jgi:transposase
MQQYSDSDLRAIYRQGEDATVAFMKTLLQRLDALEKRVEELSRRGSKTSRTSSKPPSSDGYAKPKSLRVSSGKPPGAEPGHPGETLRLRETPDTTVIHRVAENPATPMVCSCGTALLLPVEPELLSAERRQVFDLPVPLMVVSEHRVEVHACLCCGREHRGAFPPEVNAPVQFGDRFTATAGLLNVQHCLPVFRSAELLGDLFGHQVSTATIHTMVERLSEACKPSEEAIKAQLKTEAVNHADETGIRCNGALHWVHSVSTPLLTWMQPSTKRGIEGIKASGILTDYHGILVHDCWRPYFALECRHALCNAHLLRELLAFVEAKLGETWAAEIAAFLRATWHETKAYREQHRKPSPERTQAMEQEYIRLVQNGLRLYPHKSHASTPESATTKPPGRIAQSDEYNLLERLHYWAGAVLLFWYDPRVPFDNNQAERDIRMLKVKQKVSGGFRTFAGAEMFCRIRSYCSTVAKHGRSRIEQLVNALAGMPFLPMTT